MISQNKGSMSIVTQRRPWISALRSVVPECEKKSTTEVARIRACPNDAVNRLDRFLHVAAGDILLQPIKHLLEVHPNVSCPDILGFSSFEIFRDLAVYFLIVSAKNLGYVGIFGVNVEGRTALDIVKKFLPDGHPVFLGAVSPLISHGNETAGVKWLPPHHHHKIWQRLESVVLIAPSHTYNDESGKRIRSVFSTHVAHQLMNCSSGLVKGNQIVRRVLNCQGCLLIAHQTIHLLPRRGIKAPDSVAGFWILPHLAGL